MKGLKFGKTVVNGWIDYCHFKKKGFKLSVETLFYSMRV